MTTEVLAGAVARRAALVFAWWRREILACVPARVLAWLRFATADQAWVEAGPHGLRLHCQDQGTQATFPLPPDRALPARLRAVLARSRVTVRISPDLAFVSRETLPLAAEANLAQVVRHHCGLLVPLDDAEMVFDFAVIGRDDSAGALSVLIGVMKTMVFSNILAACAEAGLQPAAIRPGESRLDFLRLRPLATSRAARRPAQLLDYANLGLLAGFLLISWWQAADRVARLTAESAALRGEAASAIHLGREIEAAKAQLDFLRLRLAAPPRASLLDELARVLPAKTWASELGIDGGDVTLSGNTANAAELVSALEGSSVLGAPRFTAPVTAWQDGSLRFEVALTVKGKR